jgi:hypothetical protein
MIPLHRHQLGVPMVVEISLTVSFLSCPWLHQLAIQGALVGIPLQTPFLQLASRARSSYLLQLVLILGKSLLPAVCKTAMLRILPLLLRIGQHQMARAISTKGYLVH